MEINEDPYHVVHGREVECTASPAADRPTDPVEDPRSVSIWVRTAAPGLAFILTVSIRSASTIPTVPKLSLPRQAEPNHEAPGQEPALPPSNSLLDSSRAALTTDLIDWSADERALSAGPKKDTHADESLKEGIEWAHHSATEVGLPTVTWAPLENPSE